MHAQFFGDTAGMRSFVALVVSAGLAFGCHPPDPARRMQHAQYVIAGGLVGVLASSLALLADESAKNVMIPIIIGFGAVTAGGFAAYLGASSAADANPATQQQIDDEAWQMTKRAQQAARTGDCERVMKLAPAVKAKDGNFYDVVFMRDAAIRRCFAQGR